MSHFIISWNSVFIFGAPNGQASTQLLQAIHRGLRADWTTPSPVRLIASAGQTSAQVGCSQCMHTTGTVWTLRALSMNSRWIIDSPRCVSHSVQACTHASQPMHRFGLTKKCRYSGFGMVLLLRLQHRRVPRRAVGFAHAAAAHFVLRDLADRILRRNRQPVRALVAWPVVRDEDRVRTNRGDHHRAQCNCAATGLRSRPFAVAYTDLVRQPRVHLEAGFRVLIDERPNPARLRAGQEMADDTPGRQKEWVLNARIIDGRAIFGDVEPRLAVGKVKRPCPLRDRVVAAAFKQARSAGMVDQAPRFRIVAVARPEHAHLCFDLFVRNPGIVGDAAFAGAAQLVEELVRAGKAEPMRAAEPTRDVLNDSPILSRVAWRIDRLVDLDDAPFDLCNGAFILLLEAAGQHDVGMTRGVGQEEVDGSVELESFQCAGAECDVRQRHDRVEANRQGASDLTGVDRAKQLVGVAAWTWQLFLVDGPDSRDVLAMLRIADIAPARQLVAFLPVLAASLPVGLARDRPVTAFRFADAARGEHQVDRTERVLDTVRMMLDAARVKQKTGLRGAPPFSGLAD